MIRLWGRRRPKGDELDARIQRELRIVRLEGFRMVQDPWGNWVKIELERVRNHVVYHPEDRTRWRLVPLIIPTIKQASRFYEKGRGRTYEAELQVTHRDGEYDRTVFVKTMVDVTKGLVFASIISPIAASLSQTERVIGRERKRAGRLLTTRPNPGGLTYKGIRDSGQQRRGANRLPGAAPALSMNRTPGFEPRSRAAR